MTLRKVLFTVLFLLGLYLAGLGAFIAVEVLGPGMRLREEAEPVARVHRILDERSRSLSRTVEAVRAMAERGGTPDAGEVRRLWSGLLPDPDERPTRSYARVPARLRGHMIQADAASGLVADELLETLILLRLGRLEEARTNLGVVAELQRSALDLLGSAQQEGLEYVVALERELAAAASTGIRGVVGWVLAGVLLLPFLVVLARRRVAAPLADLDRAAARVASGDLDVEIEPRYDDELGSLARQFNQMIGVVRARGRAQGHLAAAGELLSGVAHEVKNPLMAISALAGSRLDEPDMESEVRDDWTEVQTQARRAGKIVQDLLRFVKGEEDTEVETVHLQECLDEAISLVSYRFEVDEIEFSFSAPPDPIWVRAVPDRLDQVLVNLFSNALSALRRVDPPRTLALECRLEEGRAVVAVMDDGPGVAPRVEPGLFSPFRTEGSETGTGLGLYISRNLMREMGGGLRYVPEPGRGARFEAWLAVAPPPDEAAPEGRPAEEAHRTGETGPVRVPGETSVLLVEDEKAVRRAVRRFLHRKGFAVVEAGDGLEALERLDEGPTPDVIVSDLRMPRMDGLALLQALEERDPRLADRVLILSGDISIFSGDDSALAPEQVLVKPVELPVLVERIETVASRKGRASG